jgi:hypothetical protein
MVLYAMQCMIRTPTILYKHSSSSLPLPPFYSHTFCCLRPLGLFGLWLHVRRHKELRKEEKERENVHHIEGNHSQTNTGATRRQQVTALGHHGDKLEQLHECQGRLPPNGKRLASFRNLGVHADKVVSVHDSVDESVQDNSQENVTIVVDVRVEPVKEKDGQVMVDVQKGKLTPLLAKDDKDGVPKVPDLGNVKQPEQVGKRRVLLAVSVARHDSVVVTVRQHETFNRHVRAQHDLRNIVDKLDGVRINGGDTQLHNGGADKDEYKVAQGDVDGRGKVRQRPSLFLFVEKRRTRNDG